mmetsp:Transcript_35822/g.43264  ORF Transcript_35822/g.43264 Transcript_35822/m.43264 type:complete len:93 (+) Transcript_35822:629-907(+)
MYLHLSTQPRNGLAELLSIISCMGRLNGCLGCCCRALNSDYILHGTGASEGSCTEALVEDEGNPDDAKEQGGVQQEVHFELHICGFLFIYVC